MLDFWSGGPGKIKKFPNVGHLRKIQDFWSGDHEKYYTNSLFIKNHAFSSVDHGQKF